MRAKVHKIFDKYNIIYISYGDGGKASATRERRISNARHTVGDGDGGKARATIERLVSNGRYTIADGDGGETRAIIERFSSNARHGVFNIFVGKLLWYYNTASVIIRISGYFCLFNL